MALLSHVEVNQAVSADISENMSNFGGFVWNADFGQFFVISWDSVLISHDRFLY